MQDFLKALEEVKRVWWKELDEELVVNRGGSEFWRTLCKCTEVGLGEMIVEVLLWGGYSG